MSLSTIPEIVAELRAGRMVVLIDAESRENEGDLVLAANHVTPEAINFMATHARGLICLTLTQQRCEQIGLKPMVQNNGSSHSTAFTASIEAAEGVTTGISAADRAQTIRVAVAPNAKPTELVQPGHVFPLTAQDGGVLARAGHTEAGCDLASIAGLEPAAVICEIMNADGTMARLQDLKRFAMQHGLKIGAISDLIEYRCSTESLIERMGACAVQTAFGAMQAVLYRDHVRKGIHLALVHGQPAMAREPTLVFRRERPSPLDFLDTRATAGLWNLQQMFARIGQAEAGVAVLMNVCDSTTAFARYFSKMHQAVSLPCAAETLLNDAVAAQILSDLDIHRTRILSEPLGIPRAGDLGLEVAYFESQTAALEQNLPAYSREAEQNMLGVMRLLVA